MLLLEVQTALAKSPLQAADLLDQAMQLLSDRVDHQSFLPVSATSPWFAASPTTGNPFYRPARSVGGSVNYQAAAAPPKISDSMVRFGKYVIHPGSRTLFREGRVLDLGSRAFDLLYVLIRAQGTVVEKQDIVRRVWPSTLVEESNLRFQMAQLRRALGVDRDLIKTIPGRGYLFVTEVETV
jgi:DNA-binding winged helix-turn-helix (wHTH) protein